MRVVVCVARCSVCVWLCYCVVVYALCVAVSRCVCVSCVVCTCVVVCSVCVGGCVAGMRLVVCGVVGLGLVWYGLELYGRVSYSVCVCLVLCSVFVCGSARLRV